MTINVPRDENHEAPAPRTWQMSHAAASFDEIAASAQREGPQRVTEDGRDLVVVVSARDYHLMSRTTGQALIDAMQACPVKDFTFDRESFEMIARDADP